MCKLSICIPTYNRTSFVKKIIKSLEPISHHDFEIVIVNEPDDEITKGDFEDTECDVRYFENEEYIGFGGSIVKLAEKANGDFLFYSSDEDRPNPEMIPEIITIIKGSKNMTRITGTCNKQNYDIYNSLENSDVRMPSKAERESDDGFVYYQGQEAMEVFFWAKRHLTSHIFKREHLDTEYAKKFAPTVMSPNITQILAAQATQAGTTIWLPSEMWSKVHKPGEIQINEHDYSYKSKRNNMMKIKQRVEHIIPDIVDDRDTIEALVDQECERAAAHFLSTMKDSPAELPAVFYILTSTEIIRSTVFWHSIPKMIYKYFHMVLLD
jgi:glycosyltransferase involved in cell wall biosynthesis